MSFHTTSFNHASGMHGFLHLKYLDQILLPLSIILQPPYRLAWAKICIQPTECKGTSLTAHRSPQLNPLGLALAIQDFSSHGLETKTLLQVSIGRWKLLDFTKSWASCILL